MDAYQSVLNVLSRYFDGLHRGDAALLRTLFHPEAASFSATDETRAYQRIDDWLDLVGQRRSAHALGEAMRMRVLSLNVLHDIATAVVHVPSRGFDYYNILSLVRRDDRWLIANKVFTDAGAWIDKDPLPGQAAT